MTLSPAGDGRGVVRQRRSGLLTTNGTILAARADATDQTETQDASDDPETDATGAGVLLGVIGDLWPLWLLLFVAFLLEHFQIIDVPLI